MKQIIAITGSSGLLGQYLCRYFSDRYDVIALYNRSRPPETKCTFAQIDLTHQADVKRFFSECKPHILIHTAGLTSVDKCEEMPELAYALNTKMIENIVEGLNPAKTRLVHISTDHLFEGDKHFYTESCKTHPINNYAKTKLEAEAITARHRNSLIIRTNFYGGKTSQKKSFSNWIYEELTAERKINLFNDVFFTPISVCSLGENIEHIMQSDLRGIYNIVGSERISKFTFAHMLANFFQLNSELIIQSKINQSSLRAPRPRDMSLSIEKIKKDLPKFTQESLSIGFSKIKSHNLI